LSWVKVAEEQMAKTKQREAERQKAEDGPVIDQVADGVVPPRTDDEPAPRDASEGEVLQDSIRKEWTDEQGGLPEF
jgi:hypothetical protein